MFNTLINKMRALFSKNNENRIFNYIIAIVFIFTLTLNIFLYFNSYVLNIFSLSVETNIIALAGFPFLILNLISLPLLGRTLMNNKFNYPNNCKKPNILYLIVTFVNIILFVLSIFLLDSD